MGLHVCKSDVMDCLVLVTCIPFWECFCPTNSDLADMFSAMDFYFDSFHMLLIFLDSKFPDV